MGKITLLVGKNNTGKSTFLGCCNAFSRLASLRDLEDPGPATLNCFDEKPFSMGGFRTIERHGADTFSLDGSFHEHCHTMIGFTFSSDRNGHPSEVRLHVELPSFNGVEHHLSVTRVRESPEMWHFEGHGFHLSIPQHAFSYRQFSTWLSMAIRHGSMRGGDLREFLSEEGRKLGLFSDIVKVGSDGQHEIHVQQSGGWRNIVETGFGVSSIMPMLHAMYRQQEGTTFLLQQPEINVHPSAQARLAQMMAESPHRFVIETHSDHLIDRFRICVMEEVLAPDELRIAYFQREPDREGVVIYNISVDEDGNLDGAPAGYRKFFMDETDRLLGFGGR